MLHSPLCSSSCIKRNIVLFALIHLMRFFEVQEQNEVERRVEHSSKELDVEDPRAYEEEPSIGK